MTLHNIWKKKNGPANIKNSKIGLNLKDLNSN